MCFIHSHSSGLDVSCPAAVLPVVHYDIDTFPSVSGIHSNELALNLSFVFYSSGCCHISKLFL